MDIFDSAHRPVGWVGIGREFPAREGVRTAVETALPDWHIDWSRRAGFVDFDVVMARRPAF